MGSNSRQSGRAIGRIADHRIDQVINHVIGPDGGILNWDDLPSPNIKRWVPRRKAEVVAAVSGGMLSQFDACARYAISNEEFYSWIRAYERHGLLGLQAGRTRRRAQTAESEPDPEVDFRN